MQLKRIILCLALAMAPGAHAADPEDLPEVQVTAEKPQTLPSSDTGLGQDELLRRRASTSDTAKLLEDQPGVSLYGAGGVSSLPVIHGMADDRVRVKVDGMDLISACANHMNPPLSYLDPSRVGSVELFAGIAPVSAGGDSIAGTIRVASPEPAFAQPDRRLLKGEAGIFYRSNGNARSGNVAATIANETLSMTYGVSTAEADDYKAARAFKAAGLAATGRGWLDGDEVGSSMYKTENQSLGFALRHENHLVELKLGFQDIAKQGFPNQRMDMTGNDSRQFNLRYAGQYQWGALEARAYNEHTRHSMNFLDDKQLVYGTATGGMPMDTDGKNTGAQVRADIALSERDLFRVGGEYQRYRLNDWWLPSGTGGMSPNTFWNINNGERDRLDIFGEWEARWNPQWVSLLGARYGKVEMDTGNVQGYNTGTYGTAANTFNALNHRRSDDNLDLTALVRYTPDQGKTFEAGYAMKTRSPNLYERFAWSNSGTMVMNMNNWYGDGNGYVGNINLKPEVAHTLSATGSWHDAARELKITPYYTHVDGYIDAVTCASVGITCPARTDGFLNLTLANQTARLYGVDVSGRTPLAIAGGYGNFAATGVLSYVKGKNLTSGDHLYHIMPLNAKLALVQRISGWTNTAEVHLVEAKTDVQAARKEIRSGGYGLLNLRSSYEWKQARFDIGIENALDKFYYQPLGGAYVGQGATMMTGVPYGASIPGMGRSFNAGMTVKF